ncbi:MAG: thiamine pyrophosphate-dependent enzyme [Desulfobacterales bacterium]|nr:thiamine pyrophosphate-dependent enzyme [Desulfobacterales bacterium]
MDKDKSIFEGSRENLWCPGCGNFSILDAMKIAFERQELRPRDLLLIPGIGQSGKTAHYLESNLLHGLHGRALALAAGAKIANHKLKVVVNAGDGDCYGEGGNHFLAAVRRNLDITLLVHNNQVYGLTKGQASPTTPLERQVKLAPLGVTSSPFNPLATALVNGAGFVARAYAGEREQLVKLIIAAMAHKGFSLVDIYQPCVSFNKVNTYKWYGDRIYDLGETDHDSGDLGQALALAVDGGLESERLPLGIYYSSPGFPHHERLGQRDGKSLNEYGFDKGKMNDILAHI